MNTGKAITTDTVTDTGTIEDSDKPTTKQMELVYSLLLLS